MYNNSFYEDHETEKLLKIISINDIIIIIITTTTTIIII